MVRQGRDLEIAYSKLFDLDKNKYKVTSPARLWDKASRTFREIDVLIEYKDDKGYLRKIDVECRKRKSVSDSKWLDELVTRKEDLELDYIIALTNTRFTRGAINKAKYHGIIIEKAEMLEQEKIDEITKQYYVDILFFSLSLQSIRFLVNTKEEKFYNMWVKMTFQEQNQLRKFLNQEYYYSENIAVALRHEGMDKKIFYEHTDNIRSIYEETITLKETAPQVFHKYNIKAIKIKTKFTPYKITLPFNESLSVFDGENGTNKKYKVVFGNEEEQLIGYYLDDNKFVWNMELKERPNHRFVELNMNINTVFPGNISDSEINVEEIFKKAHVEFDFKELE